MATVTSRANLSQGTSTVVTDAVFTTGVGADIGLDSAGSNLPAWAAGEFCEVRDHSSSQNNGLYQVVTVNTSTASYELDKVRPVTAPVTAGSEQITTLGATGASTEKSVFFDVYNTGDPYIMEQGNVSGDGVSGQAIYSFMVQEYKDDDFLSGNSAQPMASIDSDAGKYLMGQNDAGTNTGATWGEDTGFSIRTRKLLRNMGWDEYDASGNRVARYVCVLTVDGVADSVNDYGFYKFGTNTIVDDTVDFDFPGPVNEAVAFFEEQTQTDLAITTTTITRVGGSFITEGYKVGGKVTIRAAEDTGNDGDWLLSAVTATVLTSTGLTANVDDTTAILAVNNAASFQIGMRQRGASGKTFAGASLTTIQKSSLSNFIYQFPLKTGADDNIVQTDAYMDITAPWNGMTLTMYAAPQARSGLVGGSFNFGFIGDANGGTAQEFYEWLQYQLRKLTDIDADADTHIGRCMDLMAAYSGGFLQVGSADIGTSFPTNPDGGGSGFYVDDLNATSDNEIKFWDNTGTLRQKPVTTPIVIDGNATAIDDTAYKFDLYYDRTIRTAVADFVLTNSTSKITSATTALPQNADIVVGKYIRVAGLLTTDEPMNGVYQITVITTPGADWTVTRVDGVTIVDVTTTAANVDQYPIDSPDYIIVDTAVTMTETTITFTSPDTITDSGSGFGIFASGDVVRITGTTTAINDGIYTLDTVAAGSITTIEQTITTQGGTPSVTITKIFSGLMDADYSGSFAYDSNVQGGRTVSTNTYVVARGSGLLTGKYSSSTVQTIESGVTLTIPLTAAIQRNVV